MQRFFSPRVKVAFFSGKTDFPEGKGGTPSRSPVRHTANKRYEIL